MTYSMCPNCFSSKNYHNKICTRCGYQDRGLRDSKALPAETILRNRYIVGRVLGIGGFGITYVGNDVETRHRVAIKEYFPAEWASRAAPEKMLAANTMAKDSLYTHGRDIFVNEAKILHSLRDVDHVVKVRDFFPENGTAYMVMELVDGYTLKNYMKAQGTGKLSYDEANRIVKEVGTTMAKVHEKMLLHRDIGPDNIMLKRSNGEVKLIDFGSTRMYGLNSPRSMSVLVKPGFAPLEQYSRTGRQGPWTDVYALAATYYYLVSGKKVPGAPDRITGTAVTPLNQLVPEVPAQISRAITHALSLRGEERPENMYEFLGEMGLFRNRRNEENDPWKTLPTPPLSPKENRKAALLLQMGDQRLRYHFPVNQVLKIGRSEQVNHIVLKDQQVSGEHCAVRYNPENNRFALQNFSGNRTFTAKGTLNKGQGSYLTAPDWFYIQTMRERYIFYLEVE